MKKIQYSILMACYNNWFNTITAINSLIEKAGTIDFELIVCNDGSTDETKEGLDILSEHKHIKVIHNNKNIGVPKSINRMLDIAKGKYILRVDNDIKMETEMYLDKMCYWFGYVDKKTNEKLGALSCITDNTSGSAGGKSPTNKKPIIQFSSEINGYCQMLPKKAIIEVGGIDINFPKVYGEDRDLVYRIINKGYVAGICFDVFCWHKRMSTFPPDTALGSLYWRLSNKRMKEKW